MINLNGDICWNSKYGKKEEKIMANKWNPSFSCWRLSSQNARGVYNQVVVEQKRIFIHLKFWLHLCNFPLSIYLFLSSAASFFLLGGVWKVGKWLSFLPMLLHRQFLQRSSWLFPVSTNRRALRKKNDPRVETCDYEIRDGTDPHTGIKLTLPSFDHQCDRLSYVFRKLMVTRQWKKQEEIKLE